MRRFRIDGAGRALSSGSPPVLLWNMGRKRKERVFNAPSFYPFLAPFKMKELPRPYTSPALARAMRPARRMSYGVVWYT